VTDTITSPAFITLNGLDDDQQRIADKLTQQLSTKSSRNNEARGYYEGSLAPRTPALSVPPKLRHIDTVLGWPGMVVDALEERLDFEGWVAPNVEDAYGLGDVYTDNSLAVESQLAHLDALMYGVSFVAVGSGEDDEADPLITVQSPLTTTALYDIRRRRLSSAYTLLVEEGEAIGYVLYLPDETITAQKDGKVIDRDRHNLGRVLVARLTNRARTERDNGRSEITRPIRALTDAAVRTILGMEVNREFYSAPQRYVLGGEESLFENPDGTKISNWEAIMGRVWNVPRNEDGELPGVGQFPANSPAPYLDQVKGLAQIVAAEAALPVSYLGFQQESPNSGDAIRAGEARLVKRAERRQLTFGQAWREVARLALMVRDGGKAPDEISKVQATWRDAATPTRSAAADEALKLVTAKVLPPDSEVTYDRLGISEIDKIRLASDVRKMQARDALAQLSAAAAPPATAGTNKQPDGAPSDKSKSSGGSS